VLALAAACGSPSGDDDQLGPDAGMVDGSMNGDAPPGCTRPSLDDPALKQYVTDVVAQLAAAPRYLTTERSAARTYLMGQLSAQGWQPQLHTYNTGANVVATVPATMGTGKMIVLGAHFDSYMGSPGANDNASGVAVVLAVGRYLKNTPCRTAPVVLALFDQEEAGLFGARAYAQTLTASNVRAVHTIDQVAWDGDGDRRFELELPTATLETEWKAAAMTVGVPVTKTTTSGTDHEAFRDLGFAAVGLTEEYVGGDTSPKRHTAGDTPSSIEPYLDYLVLASKLTGQVILNEVSP
jgi:Zn-dependent M28 family amino/carboxypeptidase